MAGTHLCFFCGSSTSARKSTSEATVQTKVAGFSTKKGEQKTPTLSGAKKAPPVPTK